MSPDGEVPHGFPWKTLEIGGTLNNAPKNRFYDRIYPICSNPMNVWQKRQSDTMTEFQRRLSDIL